MRYIIQTYHYDGTDATTLSTSKHGEITTYESIEKALGAEKLIKGYITSITPVKLMVEFAETKYKTDATFVLVYGKAIEFETLNEARDYGFRTFKGFSYRIVGYKAF